ncbi:single-stranded DNA-binding protein [Microbacterium lacticum]
MERQEQSRPARGQIAQIPPGTKALCGFLDADPFFTRSNNGIARIYVRVGVEHFRRDSTGARMHAGTTYHHLVAFREVAERMNEIFRAGDHFIAQGYVRPYRNASGAAAQEFVASSIGHDAMHADYVVFRDVARQPAHRQPSRPGQNRRMGQSRSRQAGPDDLSRS